MRPDELSPEVGGLQNTASQFGASLGTALAGSVMIAAVSTSFLAHIQSSDAIPNRVKAQAETKLAAGVPFVSDADLQKALDEANVRGPTSDAALDAYKTARIDGLETSLAILAVLAIMALFYAQRVPTVQPGSAASRGCLPVTSCGRAASRRQRSRHLLSVTVRSQARKLLCRS